MATKKILVVLTSHSKLGNTGAPTGWYLPEFSHAYDVFAAAGYTLTVASPLGGATPIDPSSIEAFKADDSCQSFLTNQKALYENTIQLSTLAGSAATAKATANAYDAVYYPGGHGPMFDLATDANSQRLIAAFALAGKVVSAVCHGPAAFLNVHLNVDNPQDASAPHLLTGHKVSALTDAEEKAAGTEKAMPFALETELRKVKGVEYVLVEPWHSCVAASGKVITGQNPTSTKAVGEAVVAALKA